MGTQGSNWKRTWIVGCASLAWVVTAGCSEHTARVHIMDVADGAYLRGVQVSTLDLGDTRDVMRSELYLDGGRIAADDFAPFELGWDSRDFADGPHDLTARIYFSADSFDDETTTVLIDNTPPAVDAIPTTAAGYAQFFVDVSDNLQIARVEVTRDVAGEPPIVLTAPPYAFPWSWGCGTTTVHVRVIDAAGGDTTASASVTSTDSGDLDCDGYRSVAAGGTDCDDTNAFVHPGAPEPPEGFDRNCDGVVASLAGVDSDGDGVPSFADGGSDCDDTDPTIYGDYYQLAHVPLIVGGVPVVWDPGEAALEAYLDSWQLSLNRGGIVERYSSSIGTDPLVEQVATGANPSSIFARNGLVAFGRGNDLVIMHRGATGGWEVHSVIHAAAPVGKLFVDSVSGVDYAAFQAGTELWFAYAPMSGASWTLERLDDAGEPLVENPSGYAFLPTPLGASFVFRTSHGVSHYSRGPNQAFARERIGPADHVPTALAADLGPAVAVDDGTGSAIYIGTSAMPVLRTPLRVIAMSSKYPSLFLQFAGANSVEVYELVSGFTSVVHTQTLADVPPFDVSTSYGFARSGQVDVVTSRSVSSPVDPPSDGVDRNCDGRD